MTQPTEEQMRKALEFLDFDGSGNAALNLHGAVIDFDYTKELDEVSVRTIRRVLKQLTDCENALKPPEAAE